MNENNPDNVLAAFELLLEAVEAEIDLIDKVGARAFERHDHHDAHEAAERAEQATTFREKILSLRKEWERLTIIHKGSKEEIIRDQRRNLGRLQKGVRTPESAYYEPILKVLEESGGSARMRDVLPRVEQLMRGKLKKVDYEPLPSDGILRWSKAAQWARKSMVEEGLLKSNSPIGIWEITETGRMAITKEVY
jgi:restriction system protein